MSLLKALISVLLVTISSKCLQAQPPVYDYTVYWDFQTTSCTLPCQIAVNGSLSQAQVSWSSITARDGYLALNDSAGWEAEYQKELCRIASPSPIFYNFTNPSYFPCTVSGGSYVCDQPLDSCYRGLYRCSVELPDGSVQERSVRVTTTPRLIIDTPLLFLCYHPTASNHSAVLLNDSTTTSRMMVTWDSSDRHDNVDEFSCDLPYCRMSRQYKVNLRTYDSVPQSSDAQPDSETGFLKTKKRRQTFRVFEVSGSLSSSGKIYQFQTRNERSLSATTREESDDVQIVSSKLFHFGPAHVGASLTEPSSNIVHNASSSDTVHLRCNGVGTPAPNITLSFMNNGQLTVSQQTVGQLIDFPFIVNGSVVFTCTASNYIVNAAGEAEHVSQSATITINQISQSD